MRLNVCFTRPINKYRDFTPTTVVNSVMIPIRSAVTDIKMILKFKKKPGILHSIKQTRRPPRMSSWDDLLCFVKEEENLKTAEDRKHTDPTCSSRDGNSEPKFNMDNLNVKLGIFSLKGYRFPTAFV